MRLRLIQTTTATKTTRAIILDGQSKTAESSGADHVQTKRTEEQSRPKKQRRNILFRPLFQDASVPVLHPSQEYTRPAPNTSIQEAEVLPSTHPTPISLVTPCPPPCLKVNGRRLVLNPTSTSPRTVLPRHLHPSIVQTERLRDLGTSSPHLGDDTGELVNLQCIRQY